MANYWIATDNCLMTRNGDIIRNGEEIPEGAISPERLRTLVAKGKVRCEQGGTVTAVPPAPILDTMPPVAGPLAAPKRGRGRPRKDRS